MRGPRGQARAEGGAPNPRRPGLRPGGGEAPPRNPNHPWRRPPKGAPPTGIPEIRRGSKVPSGYYQPYPPGA